MIDDERFIEIADAAPFPMWRSDADGNCAVLNAAWTQVTGQSAAAGRGHGWKSLIHPDDLPTIDITFVRAAKRATAYQAEYRIRQVDGSFKWVVDSATPRLDERGRLLGYVGSLVDIGDRKAAELELAQAERRLRIATAAAGIGIWEWNLASNVFNCSPLAIAIFGFAPKEQITFEDFRTVMHPDDLQHVQAVSARALDPDLRSSEPYRYRIIRPDTNEVRWILAHAEATFDEASRTATHYIGTFQDVSEAYAAEQALRDSEARLRMALEAAGLVVWELDLEAGTVTPSPDLNRFFGFGLSDEPTLDQLRTRYAPGERERLARLGEEARARGETSLNTEFRFVLPDGSMCWALLLAQEAPPAHGSGRRAIGILMDVTERKASEERLKTIADELRHRVKNTLTVVQSLAAQTFRGVPLGEDHLDRFLGRVRALAAATNALTAGEGTAADLKAVVEDVTRPYRDKDHDPFVIEGEPVSLNERAASSFSLALHELCTNAVKYGALSRPQGTISIRWETEDSGIALEWTETGGPSVVPPVSKGFGSRLLAGLFPNGEVDHEFHVEGVFCRLRYDIGSTNT